MFKIWARGRRSKRQWKDDEVEKASQAVVAGLERDFRLAAYSEKYLNFRHFDMLRWQVPGLAFVVGGGLLGFGPRSPSGALAWPVLVLYGVFALLCAWLMHRIGVNLKANNVVLRRYALSIGDDSIPTPPGWCGAAVYIEVFLGFVGLMSLVWPLLT